MLYHWRALRAGRRWRSFRSGVATWLEAWPPRPTRLILVGPSGGHTLPSAWLRRFARIDAYDLDPLAPFVFRLRHFGARVRFHREDVFWREGRLSTAPLARVLDEHPDAAILFSNVIGQVLLEGEASEEEWTQYLSDLRGVLHERSWASYHDRFTEEGAEAIDHLTGGVWPEGLAVTKFDWPLTPASLHRIEAIKIVGKERARQ